MGRPTVSRRKGQATAFTCTVTQWLASDALLDRVSKWCSFTFKNEQNEILKNLRLLPMRTVLLFVPGADVLSLLEPLLVKNVTL